MTRRYPRRRPRLVSKEEFEARLAAESTKLRRPLPSEHEALAKGLEVIITAHQKRRKDQQR